MILSFKTKINGKPTYFPEKIIAGLYEKNIVTFHEGCSFLLDYKNKVRPELLFNTLITPAHKGQSKIHTIRKDDKNRWKPGLMIDFFINARQKDMFRFAPRVPLKSKQRIFMTYLPHLGNGFQVSINGRELDKSEIKVLAVNDGFETVEDFEDYFISEMENDEYSGKIIHWTDFKY